MSGCHVFWNFENGTKLRNASHISSLSYASCKDLPHVWTKCPAMLTVLRLKLFSSEWRRLSVSYTVYSWSISKSSLSIESMQVEQPDSLFPTGNRSFLRRFKSYPHFYAASGQRIVDHGHITYVLVICDFWPSFSKMWWMKSITVNFPFLVILGHSRTVPALNIVISQRYYKYSTCNHISENSKTCNHISENSNGCEHS